MPLPILYSFRRCPYAMRARLAITASGQGVHLREILLRDKAPDFLEASAKGTVPVLVTPEGQVIDESLDIMFWALRQSDPLGWLALDSALMKTAHNLISRADDEFKENLDRYKYASRHQDSPPDQARNQAALYLLDLNARLADTPWLLGHKPSIADFAIAPFVRQFANVDRPWFDSQLWPHLLRWLEAFLASDLFASIMQKYPKWQAGDAPTPFPQGAPDAPQS